MLLSTHLREFTIEPLWGDYAVELQHTVDGCKWTRQITGENLADILAYVVEHVSECKRIDR